MENSSQREKIERKCDLIEKEQNLDSERSSSSPYYPEFTFTGGGKSL